MFNFFAMAGNYDQRKVGRNDYDWGFISTARVTDGRKPYETAIKINDNPMIIVDCYDNKEQALKAHNMYVELYKDNAPNYESLEDCSNSDVQQVLDILKGNE